MSPEQEKAATTAKDNKDIAKGAGANFFGFIIRLGSRLPFLILAVALFGNELYGRYNYTITTIEICAAFATFGFKRSLFKFINDDEYSGRYSIEQVMVSALLSSVIVSLIFTGLIILGAEFLAYIFDYPEMVPGLKSLAPMVIIITALDVILAGTRATRKMRYEVISRSLVEPYMLLGSMLLFFYMGFTTFGLLMAYAVALIAALIYAIWGFCHLYSFEKTIKARPDFKLMKRLMRFSGPTAFHDLALLVFMRMDIFTVKFFFSEAVLGVYTIAQQFATSVEKIYQSFYPILSPVMAKNLVEKDFVTVEKQMIMVSRWILMIQSVLVILCVFYGETIFNAILPAGTEPNMAIIGGIVLFYLMVGETINGGFGMADLPVIYRTPLFNPIISLTMIPVYVLLAYLLTQYSDFGPIGVAMALCSTYFLMNLVRVITIIKLYSINMITFDIFRVILAAAVAAGLFHLITIISPFDLINGWGFAVGLPVLFLIYGLSMLFIAMKKSDVKKLKAKFL
ncbi:oligosaccharide flippase family protein [Pseudemcibacter aquimaris]|uniref:oligosaccharide flippase family protein n=1 Tax=Pseudemcibacter aquimaris TaxID=2857064 RepID=UPI002011CE0B|nr:oligosaccharide flippase family protein [Pseudemcibacter aquimaris]MCC3862381.1 oligosaccharide flippase family protein [Pseudemcibacter aquimaris]WDU59188.1 oligosaccharide flippase family protein [Pseudemcibacter aquimaris]